MSRPAYIALTLAIFAVLMAGVAFVLNWTVPPAAEWLAGRIGEWPAVALVVGACIGGWVWSYRRVQREKSAR